MIALAFLAVLAGAADYDAIVAEGIARGRDGDLEAALTLFDRAIALDPSRPEARVERGGLRFLERRYGEAIADLERALSLREDEYTRDLLASSLHLAGRSDEALAAWNVLGQPTLGALTIAGLVRTRDRVARREITLAEGETLGLSRVRESRLRLSETGAFQRATIRPVPKGGGHADAEVALLEARGLAHGWVDLVTGLGVGAMHERIRLRYANLGGEGIAIGGLYRWEENRPEASLSMDWPRPVGLGAYLHVLVLRGEQAYAVGDPLRARARGADVRLRRVVGPGTVAEAAFHARYRSFSAETPLAEPGSVRGFEAALDHRLVDRFRQRVDLSARLFGSALGSDERFARGTVRAGYQALLASPEGSAVEESVLAAQIVAGWGSEGTPLDEAFAPGGSPDMELPLRAHPQAEHGILGTLPIGRSLLLGNLEWRRRIVRRAWFQAGLVLFYDAARVSRTLGTAEGSFHDVGLGLRLALPGSSVLRLDWGHGLTDGRDAVFFGLRQTF